MNKLILVLAIIGAVYFWQKNKSDTLRASSYEAAAAKQADPCEGKKFCATIYVAPWCPACKAELPRIRGFLEKARQQKDYGLTVVVGNGQKPGDNEEMAKQIGAGATVDNSLEIFRQLKVTKFPSFYILDKEKAVVLADMEAFQWMHEKF